MASIYGALLLWFSLTAVAVVFVLWDQLTYTPSSRVMTVGWVLIILYTGPIGLFFYFLSCRAPRETHDQFIRAHWKQAVGSQIHCIAGDATAIIIMAAVLYAFDVANGIEVLIEYVVAYLVGLLLFQALFMRSMYSSYVEAITKTLFAETMSMNFVMAGMFVVMLLLAAYFPVSKNPFTLYFWGRMSLATLAAFVVSYPINSWLVRKNIKHGMMSKQSGHAAHRAPGEQGEKLSVGLQWLLAVLSFVMLAAVLFALSFIVPIHF